MGKKKRRKRRGHGGRSTGGYASLVGQGQEILDRFQNGERLDRRERFERVYRHYARQSVQRAMFAYARGRGIATLRVFRPLFPGGLKNPEDILPLAFYFASKGRLWPSFHGTVTRQVHGRWLWDLVLEVDFKPNWKVAFESARPLIRFLQDFGVDFRVKFSGHSSPHIIIPAEAFPPGTGNTVYMQILDYAKGRVQGRAHLDMSFRIKEHFLRLAYSINEQAGMVSVPVDPDRFDGFNPRTLAEIESVEIVEDWWAVPDDAPERTSEMIRFVLERKSTSVPKKLRKSAAKQFKRLPAEVLMAAGPKARADALRRLQMPYEQMLKTGWQMFERRDELVEKASVRAAVERLRGSHRQEGVVSVREAAMEHGVDAGDLWFLWRWTLREQVFAYYAREDVQEAMFLHAIDRKVRLGSEDVVVELVDPGDVLPLAAYIHETQGGVDYPTFYCTNVRKDITTEDVIGCDVAVRIDGKGDGEAAERMARWAVSLLRRAGADFALLVGADGGSSAAAGSGTSVANTVKYVIIPSEAVPGMPGDEEEFAEVLQVVERSFKKALPRAEGISVLPMGEFIPLFYSVNEVSGWANAPVRVDRLDAAPESGSLSDVELTQDWWEIPGEASAEMEALFRQAL